MTVLDIRSFSVAELQDEVEKRGGERIIVPAWVDQNDLRPLLRDYVDPAEVKKSRVTSIPSGVFGEGQGKFFFIGLVSLSFLSR